MSDLDRVRKYFDSAATAFDSLYSESRMNPVERWMNRTFRRDISERFLLTLEHVRRHHAESVLDVGCGSGRYAAALLDMGVQHVTGIDVSPEMIALARKAVAGREGSSEFVVTPFEHYQPDRQFDVVVAMGFFDYVQDPIPVLGRMRALARHSVVASFPSISWYRTPIRKARYMHKKCPVYFYRPEDIRLMSLNAGFTRQETVSIEGAGMDHFTVFFV